MAQRIYRLRGLHGDIAAVDGRYYAVGARVASGYREYAGIGAIGLTMFPLGAIVTASRANTEIRHSRKLRWGDSPRRVEVATFRAADQWLGIRVQHVIQAIDPGKLEVLSGAPAWIAGFVMFEKEPIAVVDLAALLKNAPTAGSKRNIIIVRSKRESRALGLLVDELAEIPEIAEELITPFQAIVGGPGRRLIDAVARPEGMDGPLLCLLDIERILELEKSN